MIERILRETEKVKVPTKLIEHEIRISDVSERLKHCSEERIFSIEKNKIKNENDETG